MKFAEYLSDNLVPEWKGKYLDYKGGKKKIKKIVLSATLLPNKRFSVATPTAKDSGKLSDFSFKRSQAESSFELPPAAIGPLDEHIPSEQNSQIDFFNNVDSATQEQTDDRTPLLIPGQGIKSKSSSFGAVTLNDNISLRKKRVDVALNPSTYGGGSVQLTEGVSLNNLADSGEKEFVEWLDKELLKIDSFYRQHEDAAVERFLVLQDQLYQLRYERNKSKSKTSSNDELLHGLRSKSNLSKLNKFEWPSLPKMRTKLDLKKHSSMNRRDYEVAKKHVPYYVARRQLKLAVQNYYRSLELIKSYRMLNRTGFRKLLKKFDKQTKSQISSWYMDKVNSSYFASSDVLDNLLPKIEDLFSVNFENGNRKVAVEKLRSTLDENQYYSSMFTSGLFYGLSIPLFIYALYFGLHKTLDHELPEGKYMLQLWGGFLIPIFMSCLFGINCYVWHETKINYKFIFEFNPKTALDYRQYSLIPSILIFALSIFSWFSFDDFWPERLPGRDWPWVFVGFSFLILFLPVDILFYASRRWLIHSIWRIMFSGFYPVEFRDLFLGNILCSLTYSMGNISFFFCIYADHWKGALGGGDTKCGSSRSQLMGFFAALPSLWRFLQCFRRYADTGDWFPHLANMLKYSISTVYFALLSVWRIHRSVGNKAVFIFFASINSIYSSIWDIFMDWSLMQNRRLLRDDIIYPVWFYYFAMISDVILRFQWIFYALFTKEIQQSQVTSFCIAVAEILRRFIWIFLRMENEHIANQHLYRASRDTPLPYSTHRVASAPRPSSEGILVPHDEEAQAGRSSGVALDQESQPASLPSRRKSTILESTVFQTVTKAIVNAHAKDFQRRPKTHHATEVNSSSDENTEDEAD